MKIISTGNYYIIFENGSVKIISKQTAGDLPDEFIDLQTNNISNENDIIHKQASWQGAFAAYKM